MSILARSLVLPRSSRCYPGVMPHSSPWFGPKASERFWRYSAAWAIGACAELLGIATGFPFGRYLYTDRWWPTLQFPSIGSFPVMLPFAWVLVVGCVYLACASRLRGWTALAAAVIATLVDQAMEPTMTSTPLRYWRWDQTGPAEAGGSPLSNAAGWFGVSLLGRVCDAENAVPGEPAEQCFVWFGGFVCFGVVGFGFVFWVVGLWWVGGGGGGVGVWVGGGGGGGGGGWGGGGGGGWWGGGGGWGGWGGVWGVGGGGGGGVGWGGGGVCGGCGGGGCCGWGLGWGVLVWVVGGGGCGGGWGGGGGSGGGGRVGAGGGGGGGGVVGGVVGGGVLGGGVWGGWWGWGGGGGVGGGGGGGGGGVGGWGGGVGVWGGGPASPYGWPGDKT